MMENFKYTFITILCLIAAFTISISSGWTVEMWEYWVFNMPFYVFAGWFLVDSMKELKI